MGRKIIDLTNQVFGDLTVISRAENNSDNKAQWLCQCICGNTRIVLGKKLRSREITHCGCKRKTTAKNISNQTFGLLTAIERKGSDNSHKALWLCQCECGNTATVRASDLISGKISSCGCIKTSLLSENLIGKRFGRLSVINKGEKQKGQFTWLCECDCGNEIYVTTNHLTTGNTQSCGCLSSKGETEIATWLEEKGIKYKRQFTFKDLVGRSNTPLRFDFAIFIGEQLWGLLEYQGIQHFQNVYNLSKEEWEYSLFRDELKRKYCLEHNIKLFEIKYNDNLLNKLGEIIHVD